MVRPWGAACCTPTYLQLGSQATREVEGGLVAPVGAGFGGEAGEGPVLEAGGGEVEEVGEAVDSVERVGAEFVEIVEEVLGGVVGGVADEGLGVDDEPGFALGAEDVSGVEVGGEEDFGRGGGREVVEKAEAIADQGFVGPTFSMRLGLLAPVGGQRGEWAEGIWRWRLAPEAAEKGGEDFVLCGERQIAERCSGLAAFEERCVEGIVSLEELNGGAAGPEAEAVDFALGFEVGHADFEDGLSAVATFCGGDEGSRDFGGIEGGGEFQGPLLRERFDYGWKIFEPSHAFWGFAAVGCDRSWDSDRHLRIVASAADLLFVTRRRALGWEWAWRREERNGVRG